MLSSFKHDVGIVFVDPLETTPLSLEKGIKLDIILSPSLYWVKKLSLPVKSVREVQKLLPSLFEDSLPEGNYSYRAYKKEDEFIIFAYEDKKILDLLSAKGINAANIHGVYFAQSEFEDTEEAYSINETQSIYVKDSLVVLVPSVWINEPKEMNLNAIKLSKHKVKLQQFGHIVDTKSLYTIAGVLGVLAVILLVEIFLAASKRDTILESKDALFTKYKLQRTMFQNKATYAKYSSIHSRQMHLREDISYFLNMKLKKTQRVVSLEVKNKLLYVSISGAAQGSERSILSQLDSKHLKYKSSFHGDTMKVEIKL